MKEVGRRSAYRVDDAGSVAVLAEIVVEDEAGERYFAHGEWVDLVGETALAVYRESMMDVYERMDAAKTAAEALEAEAARNRVVLGTVVDDGAFKTYFRELERMIRDERRRH